MFDTALSSPDVPTSVRTAGTARNPRSIASRTRLERLAALASGLTPPEPAAEPGPAPPLHGAGRLVQRWLPGGRPVSRRALVLTGAGILLLALFTLVLMLCTPDPVPEAAPPLPVAGKAGPGRGGSVSPAAESGGGPVMVSVVGKVRKPGLVSVPPGARVADAVRAAGGAKNEADLVSLNLARRLVDGEQIYLGVPVPPGAQPGSAVAGGQPAPQAAPGQAAQAKVNLNTATVEQLDTLPGVGAVTAKRIVDWRTQHGSFASAEQLREIGGIGEPM